MKQWLILLMIAILSCAGAACCAAEKSPRVAVFFDSSFSPYNVSALVSPKTIASDLSKAGVRADLLGVPALADSAKFNAQTYSAVVLPYGNRYPESIFANLKAFHQAGGCFILSGIPFTHASYKDDNGNWQDRGHNSDPALFGPDGIGVGGFVSGPDGQTTVAAGDPLHLSGLDLDWGNGKNTQILDITTLPAGDKVIPILTASGQAIAAMVVHTDPAYSGAVDVWTTNGVKGDDTLIAYAETQLLVRGTIAALAQKNLLSASQTQAAFAAVDKLPKPKLMLNVVLPIVPHPYPTLQYKTPPPAEHLYVADVSKLPKDQKLLLASLQGIVNRTQPRIYLITNDDDQFWLDQMQAYHETGTPIIVADPLSLFKTFASSIKGAVVPDPKVYVSPCVAVDIAGLDDLAIATPALAQQLGLPIKSDLRGKFKDDADALHYVRTELMGRLNTYLATCLDPAILGGNVDDIIAGKGMCFWVTGPKAQNEPGANEADERRELEETLAAMPLNAVVHGFWWHGEGVGLDETPGVTLASRFGKITTVSDLVANFSVTGGVKLASLKQKPQPPAPTLDPTKVYIAITMSDGDNLCTWRGFYRGFFTDPLHGTFPIAYGMGPSLIDIAPVQAQWYYDHAAPTDEFICDVSGAGYIYPPDFGKALKDPSGALSTFYDLTQKYMDRMDMHTLRLMGVGTADIAQAGKDLPNVAFLMPDYGQQGEKAYSDYTYTLPTGQPVFRAGAYGPGSKTLADEVRSHVGTTRPAFLNAFIWNWGSKLKDIKGMLDDLGPEFVPVTPSQLNALYREAQAGKH